MGEIRQHDMDLYSQVPLLPPGCASIRLLELSLAEDNKAESGARILYIHGKLTTYALSEAPCYEALSYTWGNIREEKSVLINGSDRLIPANVHEALLHMLQMASEDKFWPRLRIWVDSVCINQKDKAERSSQVSQMQDIFARATRCLAWLGAAHDTTSLAFDTLQNSSVIYKTRDGAGIPKYVAQDKDERAAAVEEVLSRPWFARIWILQEVVVAAEVIVRCGTYEIQWDMFVSGVKGAVNSELLPFMVSNPMIGRIIKMDQWRRTFHQRGDPQRTNAELDLKIIIMDGADRDATDLRDKLFAIRGIASAAFAKSITVDYGKSVEDVYTDCAKHLLRTRPDLRVLSLVRQGQKRKSGLIKLPSWVPDWSQGMDSGGVLQRYFRFKPGRYFNAAPGTVPCIQVQGDSNRIVVRGHRLGVVKTIMDIRWVLMDNAAGDMSFLRSTLERTAAGFLRSETYGHSNEPSWLAFFRTITADRSPLSDRINDEYRRRSKHFDNVAPTDEGYAISEQQLANPDLRYGVEDTINGKVIFLTDNNLLGCTEKGCCVDDIVCIFSGGEVPFTLRPLGSTGMTFQLHGEAYVHGAMDGDCVRPQTCVPELEDFTIE